MTDTSGDVVWEGHYCPFGEPEETTALAQQDLRFPGQLLDREIGLHYNYFRDYSPQTGRYTTSDPIGLKGGSNTFNYASGNALSNVDLFGLFYYGSIQTIPFYSGPFGGQCGPQGSLLATWIPDVKAAACDEHDECYESCARNCSGENCKLECDAVFKEKNWIYGVATESWGDGIYNDLEEEYGCDDCSS